MLPLLFLGLIVLMAIVLFMHWFLTREPRDIINGLKWGIISILASISVLLAVTGRLGWVLAVLASFLPWAIRALQLHALLREVRAALTAALTSAGFHSVKRSPQSASVIETECLRMVLNPISGRLLGRVRTGTLAGRMLEDLSLTELMLLYRFCATDENSLKVLEAWLDLEGPEDWRKRFQNSSADHASTGHMTHAEALRVLDLEAGATPDQIREAYCKLITRLHPDHGGSSYLAAQLNCAKDVLLRS